MNYITLMNEAINYIEENLDKSISAGELSNRFFISKYYFIRIFKAVTNYTVKEYIDKRRITEAAKKLIRNEKNIVDIAFEFGFESHETFTRHFKRFFLITPMEVRKKGFQLKGYEKITLVERDFKNLNKDIVVDFQIVQEKELKLFGKEAQFNANDMDSMLKVTPFVEDFVSKHIESRNIKRMYCVVTDKSINNEYGYFASFNSKENINDRDLYEMTIPETNYAVFKYNKELAWIHKTVMKDICRSLIISELLVNKIGIEFFLVFTEEFFKTNEYAIYVPIK